MSAEDTPVEYEVRPDTRPDALRLAPWILHAASLQVPIRVALRDGRQIVGRVDTVLTARAAGAPKDDDWVRFGIAGETVSANDIVGVSQEP
ncbi:MAG: hypothetical protein JHD16_00340 [Solirubrobacteraceae bacterium]|nr:hypothetical protein [Solirubrobacteraceae bacterium]